MSRKSRANVRNARRNARMTLAAGIGLLLFIGWMGTMLLFQRASLRPVDQREAIPWKRPWSRRKRPGRAGSEGQGGRMATCCMSPTAYR